MTLFLKFYSGRSKTYQVTITTATPGGTFNQLGEALAGFFKRLPGEPRDSVVVEESSGSIDNIERLKNSEANIGFAAGAAFVEDKEAQKELRVLARLYKDVLQIVVRRDSHIENVEGIRKFILENRDQKIFIGPDGSSTQIFAKKILEAVGVTDENYTSDDSETFDEAAERLKTGELKAAIFMSGMPTPAVQTAC